MRHTGTTETRTATAAAQPSEILLSIRELSVEYLTETGTTTAVSRVSLDIAPGEVVGLAGESGSGKSTIAQAILRILRAPAVITSGEILFRGRDILTMSEAELREFRWRDIALVFQSAMNSLNPVLSVGEQLADCIVAHERVHREEAIARARELLRLVDMDEARVNSYPHQLSGGMRQRVVIAMALALKPPLLLMDEPTTALDVVVQREILDRINQLKAAFGFSILFITHDLSLIFEFADSLAILYAGEVVESGYTNVLRQTPKHPYTQGLMNSFPTLLGPKRELKGIPGAPPNLRELPLGCNFGPRCPHVFQRCRDSAPQLTQLSGGAQSSDRPLAHQVSCHLE